MVIVLMRQLELDVIIGDVHLRYRDRERVVVVQGDGRTNQHAGRDFVVDERLQSIGAGDREAEHGAQNGATVGLEANVVADEARDARQEDHRNVEMLQRLDGDWQRVGERRVVVEALGREREQRERARWVRVPQRKVEALGSTERLRRERMCKRLEQHVDTTQTLSLGDSLMHVLLQLGIVLGASDQRRCDGTGCRSAAFSCGHQSEVGEAHAAAARIARSCSRHGGQCRWIGADDRRQRPRDGESRVVGPNALLGVVVLSRSYDDRRLQEVALPAAHLGPCLLGRRSDEVADGRHVDWQRCGARCRYLLRLRVALLDAILNQRVLVVTLVVAGRWQWRFVVQRYDTLG